MSTDFPNLSGWTSFSKPNLSKLPGDFTSYKCFFDIQGVCSKTAGRKQQMETQAGRTVRKSHEQSVKKRPQFYILLCCTHFCCSCSPSRWMLQVFDGLGFLPEFYFSFSPGLVLVCRAMSGTSTPRTTPGIPTREMSSCP